ncbi:hypothetical protein LOY46_11280 [Pseudomonas sichuanensis]|uniref:hypothetical protein n=1 Tax=Pseudomonas sichuanensis TaxID=2213015 RepID=UPI00215F5D01|nr:hypothetical protein [Pseudomonas sichuanensis]UVK85226.1 hypothetical protein LOY46_11280 [Pseudomonas sichuanensis]
MAKNPTPNKDAPAADQQHEAKPDENTNTSGTTAAAPAAGGQPSPGGEPGTGGGNADSPLPTEQAPALNTQVDALAAATASPAAGETTDDKSATAGDLSLLQEQPVKKAYTVTGRTDVLHDGKLYAEGDLVWLDQDSARPLLNNRCITAMGDAQ